MSQPNNPPSNPLLGAIYIDQVTNIAWVWTGTYWIQANSAEGYNAQVGPGATLVPGYYADPNPEDWFPFVGNTPPASPQSGQIWVDTTSVPYNTYVWDGNLGQFIALGGGSGSDTNSIVSVTAPTNRVSGAALEVGDLWINPTSNLASYWTGSSWSSFSSPDTHSILSSVVPSTRADGSPITVGDLWLDLDNNALQYYNGTSFVPVTAVSENVQYGAVAPTLRANGDPLVAGDLWTNSTNGASFYWDGFSFVEHMDISSHESTSAPTTKITGGSLVGGDQWYNPTTKSLYTYDSTVSGWVQVNEDNHGLIGSGDPVVLNPVLTRPNGNPLEAGDQYFDQSGGGFYVYNGTGWNSLISSDTHSFVGAGDPNTVAPYSSGTRPDSSALLIGDQYIDSVTDLAYYWTGAAWEKFANDTHSFLGSATPTLTLRPDGNPLQTGDQFIDQTANKFYYYTGSLWKQIGGDTHSIRATSAPITRLDLTPLQDGDMWVDTDNGNTLSVYNAGLAQWETVGADTHSFYGAFAPSLTQRPDGTPLLIGDQYLNTTTRYLSAWNGVSWVPIGPNTHSIRATAAPGVRPDGGALEDGDMWVDTDNGNILYVYNLAATTWDLVGPDTHSFTGTTAPALTVRPDGSPLLTGDQYLNTTTKILYAYDGAVWVIISGDTHAFTGNGVPALTTRPDNSALVEGDEYIDKVTGLTYAYYNAVWNLVGSDSHAFLGVGDPTLVSRPNGSPLQDGDQYINKTNKQAWYYDAGTATWELQTSDTHSFVGVGDPILSNPVTTRPDGTILLNGDQYVDSNNDVLYYWNGALWEILSGDGHCYTRFGVPNAINFPTRPDGTPLLEGDQVVDKNTEILYYWDGGTWEQVNPDTHSFTGNGEPVTANPVTVRPDTSPLVKGDLYIDEVTEYLYYWTGATWERITSAETHSFTGNGLPNIIIGTANRPDGDPLIDGDQYFNVASNLLYTYIAGTWILTSQDTHSFSGAVPPTDGTSGVNAGLRPDGTALLVGDQYIDTATQLLYSWYGGQWNVISGDTHSFIGNVDPASAGSGVDTGTRPDGTPLKAGDMFVNTVTDQVWYYDTGLSQWVNTTTVDTHSFTGNGTPFIASPSVGTNPQTLRPDGSALLEGDQYWDKATNIVYEYNSAEWVPVADDYHALNLGLMTNVFPTAPNTRPDSTALRIADQAMSKDKRLFGWVEDANGPGLHGWRQIIGYYRMSMYGTTLDPNTNTAYDTRITADGTAQSVLQGDMYVDSNSLGLWVADGAGNWEQVNIDTHSFSGSGVPTLTTRPTNAAGYQNALLIGDLYVDTSTSKAYYWDGIAWVILTAADTHSFVGNVDPSVAGSLVDAGNRPDGTSLVSGDQYFNQLTKVLWGWNGAAWSRISEDTHSFVGTGTPYTSTGSNPGTSPQDTRPGGDPLINGDLYVDSNTKVLYYYNTTEWTAVSSDTHSFTNTVDPSVAGSGVESGLRPDGSALVLGDLYVNESTTVLWYWDGAAWARVEPTQHVIVVGGAPTGATTRDNGEGPFIGDLYVDIGTNELYYYDGANWDPLGRDTHTFTGVVDPTLVGSGVNTGLRPDGLTSLVSGDQYINKTTDVLWYWNGTNWEKVSTPDTHSFTGSVPPTLTARPGGTALLGGDQYFDTTSKLLYAWNGSAWVIISGDTHSFSGGANPTLTVRPDGSVLVVGDQYVNTTSDSLFYWNGSSWDLLTGDSHSFAGIADPTLTTRPNGSALQAGDQYVNTTSDTLFYWNGGLWEVLDKDTHSFTGSGTPYISTPSVGTNPISGDPNGYPLTIGDQYIDTATDTLYYYNGVDWETLSSTDTHSFTGSGTPYIASPSVGTNSLNARPDGTALLTGDQYIDTATGVIYWYDGAEWLGFSGNDTHSFFGNVHPTDVTSPVAGNVRPDGSALLQGDMYVDNLRKEVFVWAGVGWNLYAGTQYYQNPTAPALRTNGIDAFLEGDIWWNSTIDRHYVRTNSATWKPYGPHTFVQSTTPLVADTYEGDFWVDTTNMTMYVYYNDGTSAQWAPIA